MTLHIRLVDVGGTVLTLLLPDVILGETTAQSFQPFAILANRPEVVRPGAKLLYTGCPFREQPGSSCSDIAYKGCHSIF